MREKVLVGCLLLCLLVVSASAHDLFLKFDDYFLPPNSRVTVRLLNGSFQSSEGAVRRERMRDVSFVSREGGVSHPQASSWHDEGKTALLDLQTGDAGTYVVGVSTNPRELDLKAAAFNEYLKEDGLPDTLEARRKAGELNKGVRERYSKHVKAVFQIGDARTDSYKTPLGYPVEITPQQNPYRLKVGDTLEVLCTLDGKPLDNQVVIAGWESKGVMASPVNARTNARGIARIKLSGAGRWYVKLIHMKPLADPKVNYESKWATLTFEIR